nr:hypothetical protein [Tanacetum cinerariifolium]
MITMIMMTRRKLISQLPSSVVITTSPPVLPTFEDPEDYLIMGNKDLSTIPEKESDEFIKSSVEDLDPIPNEFEDTSGSESKCDMTFWDDYSSKNEGLYDIVSIPPRKEIDHIDAIPDSVQSLLNRANSKKFLIEEELNSEIPYAIIESLSPTPIPIEDSDSLIEEIDIFLTPDDSIPPGLENDDYDSEGDVLFLEDLLNDDSISLPEYESFHVNFYNVPSSPRSPEKPPDDDVYFDIEPDTGILTTKVVDDISDNSTRELYEDIRLVENLLYDDSSPRASKELNSEISDAIIESFSPSHIPVKDSNYLMEEIDTT